ncbi:equilibrative nucleoside transporter 2-like isoform X1 [Paramormyrops kingsleyae]|nr:equilibrative nucleoside transporter 2-like [Paramormyrops kingsleyae]
MGTPGNTPVDRGCLMGIIFFIFGLGTLLPWNFFVTALMYFENRLNKSEWSNSTAIVRKEYYFKNWMTLLSQLPLLLFTLLNSFLYQWVSEKVRIGGSLVFILLFFILTAVLVKVPMEEDQFFSVTMATIWFINSFGAVMQGSLFGLVGLLPRKYSSIFMSGQGLAGTFAALAMVLAIASKAERETAALGYFITPCVGTLVNLMCYVTLPRLEFAQFYLNKKMSYELEVAVELLPREDGQVEDSVPSLLVADSGAPHPDAITCDTQQTLLTLQPLQTSCDKKSSVKDILKKIWVMAFCVTFVFTVTLSVFPAVTADVKTKFSGTWESYFTPVCCFLTFNVMDFTGRSLTFCVKWPPKESPLFPVLVIARLAFIPLLMLCNVPGHRYLPVLISHDAAFTVIMMLFSISSGYCMCLSMTYAPQMVEPKDGETAGALMAFFLALGLSLGAALSFPLRGLLYLSRSE